MKWNGSVDFWLVMLSFMFMMMTMTTTTTTMAQTTEEEDPVVLTPASYNFTELPECTLTSLEMSVLSANQTVEPCILYDTLDTLSNDANSTVTMVMVTPSLCSQHRDGAVVGVELMNADNEGKGWAIGFYQDFHVQFRLISVIAGNPAYLGNDLYIHRHKLLLSALLDYTKGQFRYIVGTCSFFAAEEKQAAKESETIVATQVGPPGFYNVTDNKWIFGFHVTSDDYPVASVRKLAFWAQEEEQKNKKNGVGALQSLPVRLIYRNVSEFFKSTCDSALRTVQESGFTDVAHIVFDPVGDEDNDGVENSQDEDFLIQMADEICPPGASAANQTFRPAIYMCVLTEHDILLQRWRDNGCLMTSLWLTPATWGWATSDVNKDSVDFYQGGGQWHEKFSYSDKYFESGIAMLDYAEERHGYRGGYDQVVSYAIPIFYAQHLQHVYRVYDVPDPDNDILDSDRREELRRRMLEMRVDTIFGTVQFDERQRNIGRQSASTQWQPDPATSNAANGTIVLKNALFSPDSQAEVEVVLPAATASGCKAGSFVNASRLQDRLALLEAVCSECLPETHTPEYGAYLECLPCPAGTSTNNEAGSSSCVQYQDNLLSTGMLAFGWVVMGISWTMALSFIIWIFIYRNDPVVRLAQMPFLLLICFGGLVSTSSLLGLTFQAGTGESTHAASTGCLLAPILYSVGWVIQYGSLCSKTMRLQRIVDSSTSGIATGQQSRRRTITRAWTSMHGIAIPLLIDAAILAAWSTIDPLEYLREETGRSLENGILTIESVGRCRPSEGTTNVWVFLGPLFANHLLLVAWTHYLLYKVRNVSSRYQENKYMGMAAIFALEIALVGVPILIAAQDSVEATFFVILGMVGLDCTGVLGFVFIPKMLYQKKGLEAGVTVGESILSETHKRAIARQTSAREQQSFGGSSSMMNSGYSQTSLPPPESSLERPSNREEQATNSNVYPLTTIDESENQSQEQQQKTLILGLYEDDDDDDDDQDGLKQRRQRKNLRKRDEDEELGHTATTAASSTDAATREKNDDNAPPPEQSSRQPPTSNNYYFTPPPPAAVVLQREEEKSHNSNPAAGADAQINKDQAAKSDFVDEEEDDDHVNFL